MEVAEEILTHVQKEKVSIVNLSKSPDCPLRWWRQRPKEERTTRPGSRAGPRTCRYFPRFPHLQHGRDRLTFAGEAGGEFTVVKEHHPSVHVFIHISVLLPRLHLSRARVRALLVLDQPSRLLSPFGITPLPLKLALSSSRAGCCVLTTYLGTFHML